MEISVENSTHSILYPSNSSSTSQTSQPRRTRARNRSRPPESNNADDGRGTSVLPMSPERSQSQNNAGKTIQSRPPVHGDRLNSGQMNGAASEIESTSVSGPIPNGTIPSMNPPSRKKNQPRREPKQLGVNSSPTVASTTGANVPKPPRVRTKRRGARFNTGLTDHAGSSTPPTSSTSKYTLPGPTKDDLTSTLIHALRTPPYQDCPICFNAIRPDQPTWSCSPSSTAGDGHENANTQCCWTTFHLKCICSWAGKSVKEIVDAWRARGEDRGGEWRCPGCQSKREMVPNGYWCGQYTLLALYI
jgi:transcriptional repressor NF-X1